MSLLYCLYLLLYLLYYTAVIQYNIFAISQTNKIFLHNSSHLQSEVHYILAAEGSRYLWSIIRLSCCSHVVSSNKKRALFDYKCSQTCILIQPCTDPIQVLIISLISLKNSLTFFIAIRTETQLTYHVLQFSQSTLLISMAMLCFHASSFCSRCNMGLSTAVNPQRQAVSNMHGRWQLERRCFSVAATDISYTNTFPKT